MAEKIPKFDKIKRKDCLEMYSIFPLSDFNEKTKKHTDFCPEIYKHYWLMVEAKTNIQLKKILAIQIVTLFTALNIEKLVFLCDRNSKWITEKAKERTDFKQLSKAVKYFMDNKIGVSFNGGVIVNIKELEKFVQNIYTMTRCEAAFSYYHFIDEKESIIGYIHYDGEFKIATINKDSNIKFLDAVKKTTFIDAPRDQKNKIRME